MAIEIPTNPGMKLFGRPGESAADFAARCLQAASDRADAEAAKLRDKYAAKVVQAAVTRSTPPADAAEVAEQQQQARQRDDLLSSAGRSSAGCSAGAARRVACSASSAERPGAPARRRRRARGSTAAKGKVDRLEAELQDVEAELAEELTEIDARWRAAAAADRRRCRSASRRPTSRSRSLALAWIPAP